MKDYMISMFLDDEMNCDEKIEFVETVHNDVTVKKEIIELLEQEKQIRGEVTDRVPVVEFDSRPSLLLQFWRPFALIMSGAAAALIIFLSTQPNLEATAVPYRFVIYRPGAARIDLTGSFSGWESLPMKKMGASGYWERVVELQKGEYRFSYVLENGERIPDPTILTRERDDFGGENSILDLNIKV
jgi:hypothetical protein